MIDYKLLKLRAKFRDFYNKNLIDDYRELEDKRKKYLRLFWFSLFGAILVFNLLGVFFAVIDFTGDRAEDLFEVLFVVAIAVVGYPIIAFKSQTQETVMSKIVSFFGDMHYGINRIFDKDIENSELVGYYSSSSVDDCFDGTYNGVKIKVSEQKLTRKGRKNDITIFSGLFIMLDFDKKFIGKTVVKRKGNFWVNLVGCFFVALMLLSALFIGIYDKNYVNLFLSVLFLIIMFVGIKKYRFEKKEVKLEDVVFSKKWKVYATDQIEARYLLTTAFMERILEVKRRFKGKDIEFSFFDNKLFIAVHTSKDLFETTSLFKSALSYHRIQNVVYQFYSVFSIIDLLKIKGTEENEKN